MIETTCLSWKSRQSEVGATLNSNECQLLQDWLRARRPAPSLGVQLPIVDADTDFAQLVRTCQELSLIAPQLSVDEVRWSVGGWRSLQRASLEYDVPTSPLRVHLFVPQDAKPLERDWGWGAVLRSEQLRVVPIASSTKISSEGLQNTSTGSVLSNALQFAEGCSALSTEARHSPLSLIRTGIHGFAPIFCVPGAGANVTDFIALAGALGDEVPVYGCQPRGMDGTTLPHCTVEAAAQAYLSNLQAIYPHGGVHLVGHSFGGWVVFEMSLRLQAAGRAVLSLTILDSDCPADRADCEYTRGETLMNLVSLYEQASARPLNIKLADFEERDPDEQMAHLHRRLVEVGLMPSRSTSSDLRGPIRTFAAALRAQYNPDKTFIGPVDLVLVPVLDETDEVAQKRFEATVAGWRLWSPNLQFQRGEGNHITLLRSPNIDAVAQRIMCTVRRAGKSVGPNINASVNGNPTEGFAAKRRRPASEDSVR